MPVSNCHIAANHQSLNGMQQQTFMFLCRSAAKALLMTGHLYAAVQDQVYSLCFSASLSLSATQGMFLSCSWKRSERTLAKMSCELCPVAIPVSKDKKVYSLHGRRESQGERVKVLGLSSHILASRQNDRMYQMKFCPTYRQEDAKAVTEADVSLTKSQISTLSGAAIALE